jgi:hypothetical protein
MDRGHREADFCQDKVRAANYHDFGGVLRQVLASQPGRDLAALSGSNVTPLLIAVTTGAFLTGGYDAIMACLTRHRACVLPRVKPRCGGPVYGAWRKMDIL